MDQEEQTIWMRVGMSYTGTKEEIEKILAGEATPALWRALKEGRADIDGETYIPSFVIEDYNAAEETNFPEEDIDWYF